VKNWQETYKSKVVGALEAVKHIKGCARVVVGHACGSPELLLKTMVENKDCSGTWRSCTWCPWAPQSTA
jgi:acyl-CoA hydrolase